MSDLTARQAAELLGRNLDEIKKLCRQGQFPNAYKTSTARNGRWRIPLDDIHAYRNAHRPTNERPQQ